MQSINIEGVRLLRRHRGLRTGALAMVLGIVLSCPGIIHSQNPETELRKELAVKNEALRPMQSLAFMVGEWDLDYTVHQGEETRKDLQGTGSLQYLFDGVYLSFNYEVQNKRTKEIIGKAHGIFAWDAKAGEYRYFWFESSAAFLQARCKLRDADTLFLQWQGIDCTQIFQRLGKDTMLLEMKCPEQGLVLRVDMTRRTGVSEMR